MDTLTNDWFLEGRLDYEYKKYILLAYLQKVAKEFAEVRLYPSFTELINHYQHLTHFKEQKEGLRQQFPKSISKEAFQKMQLVYQSDLAEDDRLKLVEEIIDYAIPQIKAQLKDGKEIYEYIDQHLKIEPIGVCPLYNKEGYILLRAEPRKVVKVFEYKTIFFENTDANYHGISFKYMKSFQISLANTYEHIKRKLSQEYQKLPNPATWLLYTIYPIPEESTLIPVAKRKMLSILKEN